MDEDSYQLPYDHGSRKEDDGNKPAADLIRKRIEDAYTNAPEAAAEAEIADAAAPRSRSKHQKFIHELTTSGRSIEEIQTAWHDYYAGLNDAEKHRVWQEFYEVHNTEISRPRKLPESPPSTRSKLAKARKRVTKRKSRASQGPLHSLTFGITAGVVAVVIVLFSFFNERFIAPFIQPSRSLSNVPLIVNSAVSKDPEVIIPKINVQIPVVYGVSTIDEGRVQKSLEQGVLHYADTPEPGENGNVVIVGHSSNNIFNKGKYKFAFVLLSRLEPGDTFYLQKDGKRYTYEVYQKKIVKPNDVSVLGRADRPATASLVTCDPPGTSINRLVVTGEQISPTPSKNKSSSGDNSLATQAKVIPSNSQSLWARLWSLLSR